jgi:hypothetical protein
LTVEVASIMSCDVRSALAGKPVEGRPRGGDVALDVGLLEGELVGGDDQPLDDGRVDPADQDARRDPHAEADERQPPALVADVEQEQHAHRDGDDDQDPVRRYLRVDVCVRRAEHLSAGGEVELVDRQPVVERLRRDDQPQQHGDVGLHVRVEPGEALHRPDPAVVEVDERRHHEGQDEHPE